MQRKQSRIKLGFTIALSLFFISGCSTTEENARSRIYDLTDVEIPTDSTLAYHHQGDAFQGRASQYSVFSFEVIPTEFLNHNHFNETKDLSFQNNYDSSFTSHLAAIESKYTIPDQYLVHWDENYSWFYHLNDIYFVYFTAGQILIVYIVAR